MDVPNRSARLQNKKVILLSAEKLTCLQFYRKIESQFLENILSVTEAFESMRDKQCIIVGKVVKLQSKIPNDIRKDIKEKSDPATFIILREVVASNETVTYGRLYKVKFCGAIAKEFLESDIKVGDRIALKNLAAIEKNTEYIPCARYSSLTPLALDVSRTTVIVGKKVVEELRCNAPEDEDQNISSLQNNDRTEVEEHNSPAPKSSGLCSNKRRFNNDSPISSPHASAAKFHHKTQENEKNEKMKVNSPAKTSLHLALEEDEEQRNPENNTSSRLAKISQKVKYIDLKDINESLVNSKVDVFGIVIDVLQGALQENGNNKKVLRFRIIDSSISMHKAFEILVFYTNEKPKIRKRWIARVKNVKIEAAKGKVNGRIFSPGCLICFPTEKGMPKFVTSRKKPYDFPDADRQVLKNLEAFLASQKNWNILTLPNSYYAYSPNIPTYPYIKLEDITENTQFLALKCKIVSSRIFLEVKLAYLTVEDSTVCHPRTYQFPKTAKSWSAVIQEEEVYCADSSTIDILLKNLGHSCHYDAVNLLMQTDIFVDITKIETRQIVSENNSALMFVVDIEKANIFKIKPPPPPPSQVEQSPPPEGEKEESSQEESGMKISEYNELLAECRDGSMSPATAKLLAPIPEKKRETKKRRKLVPINSDANITHLLPNSTEDVPLDENDENRPMEKDAGNKQVSSIENRNSAVERMELSKSINTSQSTQKKNSDESSSEKAVSRPAGTEKVPVLSIHKLTYDEIIELSPKASASSVNGKNVSLNEPSSSEKNKINPVGSGKVPVLLVHKLTDDEIIELSPNASVCSKTEKKGNRQSPNQQRTSRPIGKKKKTIGPKSKNGETCSSTSKPVASEVALETGNAVILDDDSSTKSKQKEACFGEECVQLLLSNENIFADKSRSPNIESSPRDEEMDQTVYKNVSLEECSLIENCEGSDNVPNSKKSQSKTSKFHAANRPRIHIEVFKPVIRTYARKLFSEKSPSVISSSSRESDTDRNRTPNQDRNQPFTNSSPESNPQNSNKKKTSQCDKTPTTPSPSLLDTHKTLLNNSHDSVGAVLDMDKSILENDGTDEDIFNPGKISSSVKNVCSELTKIARVPTTRLRSATEENEVDGKSRGSSSQTQFSPPVSSSLRESNSYIHKAVAQTNPPSPTPSIATEKYYPTRKPIKCTRKSIPQNSKFTETYQSCSSPPQSIVTEKLYIPGEQEVCTRTFTSKRAERLQSSPSPPQSIVTEKLYIPGEQEICTRKRIPQKRTYIETASSPPVFKSPESVVIKKSNNSTGERAMCTRNEIPCNTGLHQQEIEARNTHFWLERWLQQVDSEIIIGENVEPVAEPLMDESQNLQNLEESQNLAEYMTTRDDVDTQCRVKIISDNAVIINSEPSILDEPLEIVSGHCKEPCDAFFRYSTLEFNSDSKAICPMCDLEGKTTEVELLFLFKLNLILHQNRNVCYAALVHADQADQFLGCTAEEYINDEDLRSRIVNKLSEHFLLKGKTSSSVYSPSLHVNLRVSSDNESESGTINLVDTILSEPDTSSPPIEEESLFANHSNL